MTEGALAPDPAARPRPEPLREIPGLKKRERTWKDEVRDRMADRKRRRGSDGDLPLFPDALLGDVSADVPGEVPAGGSTDGASSRASDTGAVATDAERVERVPSEVRLAPERIELGVEEADLLLRPPVPAAPAPELRLAAGQSHPRPAIREREPAPRTPGHAPRGEEEWTLGGEPTPEPRPVERPAFSGERVRAALLDLGLLAILWAIVVYFASRAAHVGLGGLWPAWPYLVAYLAFLGLAYAGYFTGTTGQTLGKIATGLRVVDAGGRPPGYLRAFVRAALGSIGVMAAGAGLIPMLLDPARRALHDRLVKTRVVKG